MSRKPQAKKIVCKIDKKDSDTMIFTVHNEFDEVIETFKHYYRMNDEDDLCCKMQQKVEIKATDFYDMFEGVNGLFTFIVNGIPYIYEIEED